MKVLLIRHAEAEERAAPAAKGSDALRPLTEVGRKRFREAAEGLMRIEPELAAIAGSPLVRAIETAALVAKQYGLKPIELEAMSPGGKRAAIFKWLQTQDDNATIALVGHEPDLGELASAMLARSPARSFVRFKKGAMWMLDFAEKVVEGKGTLLWGMTQGQLRKLRS